MIVNIKQLLGKENIMITDVMEYIGKKGWNMVISHTGHVMFNKAGTDNENGSYRETKDYLITEPIENQSNRNIEFIYNLLK